MITKKQTRMEIQLQRGLDITCNCMGALDFIHEATGCVDSFTAQDVFNLCSTLRVVYSSMNDVREIFETLRGELEEKVPHDITPVDSSYIDEKKYT